MATFVTRRDAKVCFASLAWSIYYATHHSDLQREFLIFKCCKCPVSNINDINLGSTTTRACNEVNILSFAKPQCFKQLTACTCLFYGVSSEAVPNGVTNAFKEQGRNSCGGLDETSWGWPCFCNSEMQRNICCFGQHTVRLNHEWHVACLYRNLDEIEINFFEVCNFMHG